MTLTFDTHSTSLTHLAEATLRPKAEIISKQEAHGPHRSPELTAVNMYMYRLTSL